MSGLTLQEMYDISQDWHDRHVGKGAPFSPEKGRDKLLKVIEEYGELVSVVMKRGEDAIINDPAVRAALLEEFADVLGLLSDALLCYGVTDEEFSDAYRRKHRRNMDRDYSKERAVYLERTQKADFDFLSAA